MKMKKKSDPYEALFDSILAIVDYEFEGSDISDEEFELAKSRFRFALRYIIDSEVRRRENDSK